MVKLTQDMVAVRAKTSDMESITKLNLWGSDLTDISLVRQFKSAEILSFSLNMIVTLSHFQFCKNLSELYIRRNRIQDLRELCYLQELPRLKILLLSENPCCDTAGNLYRPTVIRALPNLEVLDNEEVAPTDREFALQHGLILEHPDQWKGKEKLIIPGTRIYENPTSSETSSPSSALPHAETLSQRNISLDITKQYDRSFVDSRLNQRPSTAAALLNNQSMSPLSAEDPRSTLNDSSARFVEAHPLKYQVQVPDLYRQHVRNNLEYTEPSAKVGNTRTSLQTEAHFPQSYHSSTMSVIPTRPAPKPNRNVVSAVLSLINELDLVDLEMIDSALKRRQHDLAKY